MTNPARSALSRAINRAIASGAPVYTEMPPARLQTHNSFQSWADDYSRAFGFVVTLRGNWVILHRNGQEYECLSAQGVQAICDQHGAK